MQRSRSPQTRSLFVLIVILGMLEADIKHGQFDLGTAGARLAETSSMTSAGLSLGHYAGFQS